jgi:UPF0758 protein CLI_3057
MLTLKQLPNAERPYEKLEMYGEKSLSNSELLAIILKTGTKNQTAVALAQQVLALIENRNIRALHEISIKELQKINGIGKVKAIQIKAICELAKRMSRPQDLKTQIKSSEDAANLLMEELKYEKNEIVKILILNTKNIVQKIVDISIGNTSSAPIERKRIFEEILKTGMSTFILVHNHPSGDVTPSMNDIKTTKEIKMGAELLGLKLLDHIIIGDGKYKSILS